MCAPAPRMLKHVLGRHGEAVPVRRCLCLLDFAPSEDHVGSCPLKYETFLADEEKHAWNMHSTSHTSLDC